MDLTLHYPEYEKTETIEDVEYFERIKRTDDMCHFIFDISDGTSVEKAAPDLAITAGTV